MNLYNLDIINKGTQNISIAGDRIAAIYPDDRVIGNSSEANIYFENCLAFPGLINSHDHLEFNLFPQLGNGIYTSYMYWGGDIHKKNSEAIQGVLKVPKELRVQWGIYKNLLNGITTVVQHGGEIVANTAPINIFTRCHSLHSVGLEKRWKLKLNNPFAGGYPFAIHVGEGTDAASFNEINELLRWNLFKRKLAGIHGVAMNEEQAKQFEAVVWCPDSNFFLLGKTAAIDKIKSATKILFGTDAAISANWSIWQQLRQARNTALLTDVELMDALFTIPAGVWGLKNTGAIAENYYADIVVAKKQEGYNSDADDFFATDPEDIMLVLNKGSIIFFDATLLPQLNNIDVAKYSKLYINNVCKYVIGNVTALVKEIKEYSPGIIFPIDVD